MKTLAVQLKCKACGKHQYSFTIPTNLEQIDEMCEAVQAVTGCIIDSVDALNQLGGLDVFARFAQQIGRQTKPNIGETFKRVECRTYRN